MLQSGLKDFEVTTWYGILGPAGLPRDVVTRLNTALGAAVKSPANAKRLSDNGLDPSHGTPEALAQTVASELARWAVVVKAAGIVVQ
jgi:tripartite-type tricarboxylate transporter receptor subunit TctC